MKEIVKVLGGGPGRESGRNPAGSAGRLAGSGMGQNGARLDLTKNLWICENFMKEIVRVLGGVLEENPVHQICPRRVRNGSKQDQAGSDQKSMDL